MGTHKIKYWVYASDEFRNWALIPHSRGMVGFRRWEASCSCGWRTRTGGAIQASIKRDVDWHKFTHEEE